MIETMQEARIMVVEDEAIVARDIQLQLEKLHYSVVATADNYAEALRQAEACKPDLVLMDIVISGEQDGIDAARVISSRCNIPVVFLTAFSDREKLQRASSTEPYGYLVKPFEPRELHTTIQVALCKHSVDSRLKQSLDESERLNKLMLEREFRIKELRDENKRLQERIAALEAGGA